MTSVPRRRPAERRRRPAATASGSDAPAPARVLSTFERAVAAAIRSIPPGQTLSYGGVALRAGKPRGARAVVQALRRLHDVPWWRVIRSDGTLAPEVAAEQAPRLRAEGVRVDGRRVRRAPVPAGAAGPAKGRAGAASGSGAGKGQR